MKGGICRVEIFADETRVLVRDPRKSRPYWISRVPTNAVRCLVGDDDLEYLNTTTADESGCFRISTDDIDQMIKERK